MFLYYRKLDSSNNRCISCESNELSKILSNNKTNLLTYNFNLFHQNIHSFSRIYDEFSALLYSTSKSVDVMVLSDTCFKQSQSSKIKAYSHFHTVRSTATFGRGVSVYVKNYLKNIKIDYLCNICI